MAEWRQRSGPGYDLHQYRNGRPTGVVAATARRGPVREITGQDVQLIIEQASIAVIERGADGRNGVQLLVPLRSCVDAQIFDEPGLPGATVVRLHLTLRLGPDVTLTVPAWFPGEQRPELQRFVRWLGDRSAPAAELSWARPLPLIDIELAPDTSDWVVFRPDRTSAEVVHPAGDPWDRPTGEAR